MKEGALPARAYVYVEGPLVSTPLRQPVALGSVIGEEFLERPMKDYLQAKILKLGCLGIKIHTLSPTYGQMPNALLDCTQTDTAGIFVITLRGPHTLQCLETEKRQPWSPPLTGRDFVCVEGVGQASQTEPFFLGPPLPSDELNIPLWEALNNRMELWRSLGAKPNPLIVHGRTPDCVLDRTQTETIGVFLIYVHGPYCIQRSWVPEQRKIAWINTTYHGVPKEIHTIPSEALTTSAVPPIRVPPTIHRREAFHITKRHT